MLKIFLFGKFSIQRNNQVFPVLEARKLQEILGYLLLHAARPHSREVLAELFWSESTTTQSKKNLRQALWQIQSALESLRHTGEQHILETDNDWVQLHLNKELWVDCIELEKAYRLCQDQPLQQIPPAVFNTLSAVAHLYTAELLEGCYQDWCLLERERLQNIYLELLGQLIEYCILNKEYRAGIKYCQQVLNHDRTHESTHQHLMQLYYLHGDRTAALRQYKRCCDALQVEFGASPSPLTTGLYRQIQGKELEVKTDLLSSSHPDIFAAITQNHTIKDALERLNQLLVTLASLQAETRQQVQAIEKLLKGLSRK